MPSQEPANKLVVFSAEGGDVAFAINGDRETMWGTRQQIAAAFGCTDENVRQHIRNIYETNELEIDATSKKILEVQKEGNRNVTRSVEYFNLDIVLAVGYRVSTQRATKFRQWATRTLKEFISNGFVLDRDRLINDPLAQQDLAKAIRMIRLDERNLYARVKDVFKASSSNYDPNAREATAFFAMAQDKFHFAITGKTAAEIVLERADADKPNMGLTNMNGVAPTLEEAKIAKGYLLAKELEGLENICNQFMLFAESKAFRGQKMTMEELATKLNILLAANDYPVLYEYKSYLRSQANAHAKKELDTYRLRLEAGKPKPEIAAAKKPRK